jgi:hypothetical protein
MHSKGMLHLQSPLGGYTQRVKEANPILPDTTLSKSPFDCYRYPIVGPDL